MLYTDFTEKLLGLQGLIIKNIEETEKEIHIYTEMKRKTQNCICCGTGITNSFDINITNGFTEGCNNKIKVLKRNAYGYRNFNRFRNRILHIFSHQKQRKTQAAA
mgnify:CR=1 FL=1